MATTDRRPEGSVILHTIGAIVFFAMLWAVLQYEGTPGEVLADDDGPGALTCPRARVDHADPVPDLVPVAAIRRGTHPG